MNEYEMLRVIEFLERTRRPFQDVVVGFDEDPVWRIVMYLIKSHIHSQTVSISTLGQESGLPYATSMRLINRLVDSGYILKVAKGTTGKSFALQPSDSLLKAFQVYAGKTKSLLAQTLGLRSGEQEDDYYFGGTPLGSHIIPPMRLMQKRAESQIELRFLLNNDNYFSAMRNMWADFRNNLASRKSFDLLSLPDLYNRALENRKKRVSEYDVIAINMPWLGEFVEKDIIRPIDALVQKTGINPLDFHPSIWSTARWDGQDYGVPGYCTVEILAARKDLFADAGLDFPRNFEDVIAAGRHFHAPNHGMYGAVWDGARGMPIASSFMFFLGACGQPTISLRKTRAGFTLEGVDLEQLHCTISSDSGLAALDFMRRLIEISPPDILNMAWDRTLDVFMTGKASLGYFWTMRTARFEYDVHSVVKRRVEYLPQPAGPGGTRASPIGGFLFCIPTNLPEERVELAADAIAWMASREAMKAHVKNGFPIAPRFSVSADPEAAASSPIVRFVDQLAKKNLLHTWQRPNIPQYTAIERILGEEIHNALSGVKSDRVALDDAARQIDLQLRASPGSRR
ncbi:MULTISPECIES: extracellular solute-binding protein [unclassified Rhizobium]|uniref:extracellular solute-binding protein n=1 Tax=unclassified Rhizobium TaxID=2613769 RepID=UPI001ADC850D|nr:MULTISPECIES: extracellular solute-binding protein [unclassified Rhizobium]MBO9101651.1 extracellular solute-binding protein [Rhizobium sp. L58/93]MBO9187644.1 extracellular solute-binding protein [Rhizobium sp. E27B/91]QXZ86579.1 extracellular solute-binding protein [Rhizobium sp. K1/93]QXZ93388.1 extracellular solute-binding protein [Rhizobium sp. K15/93]QYA04778.1 extracellular solute-binding protein [Rhizobium sp. B21/90]